MDHRTPSASLFSRAHQSQRPKMAATLFYYAPVATPFGSDAGGQGAQLGTVAGCSGAPAAASTQAHHRLPLDSSSSSAPAMAAGNPLPSPPPEPDSRGQANDVTVADFAAHIVHHVWFETPLPQLVEIGLVDADEVSAQPPGSFAELLSCCRRAFPITKMGLVELGVALVMLQRMRRLAKAVVSTTSAVHTLFFTVLMLTNKTLSDSPYNARSWSKLTGVPVGDLVEWERKVLEWSGWNILDRSPRTGSSDKGIVWSKPAWVEAKFSDFETCSRQARERKRRRKAEREEERKRAQAQQQQWNFASAAAMQAYPPSPPQHVFLHLSTPPSTPVVLATPQISVQPATTVLSAPTMSSTPSSAASSVSAASTIQRRDSVQRTHSLGGSSSFGMMPRNLSSSWANSAASSLTSSPATSVHSHSPSYQLAPSYAIRASTSSTTASPGLATTTPSPTGTRGYAYSLLPSTPACKPDSTDLLLSSSQPQPTETVWWSAAVPQDFHQQQVVVVQPQTVVLAHPQLAWPYSR